MLNKIKDMENGLEYEVGKIYAFDSEDQALNFYQAISKNGIPIRSFTNENQTKFYIQIENLFSEILNPTISIALPNKIPQEELMNPPVATTEESSNQAEGEVIDENN